MKLHSGPVFGIRLQKCFLSWGTLWEYLWSEQIEWCEQKHKIISRLEVGDDTSIDSGKSHCLCWSKRDHPLFQFRLTLQVTHSTEPLGVSQRDGVFLQEQPPLWTGNLEIHIL